MEPRSDHWASFYAPHLRQQGKPPPASATPVGKSLEETEAEEKREILCRQCRQGVTDPEQGISVQGGHRHTFANPHGIVFEIGCFRAVRNCSAVGPATAEFTWFSGFHWRVLICGGCLTHLGWMFSSAGPDNFFGLIVDRLVFP